jgi:hypothetical protein
MNEDGILAIAEVIPTPTGVDKDMVLTGRIKLGNKVLKEGAACKEI